MKKLTITECRKFLKDSSNIQYHDIYNLISKYVNKYDNQESQYMIQTSQAYRDKVFAEKKKFRLNGKLMSEKEYINNIKTKN